MSNFEHRLRSGLPRPAADPQFQETLLGQILSSGSRLAILEFPDSEEGRSRLVYLYYVGGAVVGAAALALSAALGWRLARSNRPEHAA